jgi:hypothetical protein
VLKEMSRSHLKVADYVYPKSRSSFTRPFLKHCIVQFTNVLCGRTVFVWRKYVPNVLSIRSSCSSSSGLSSSTVECNLDMQCSLQSGRKNTIPQPQTHQLFHYHFTEKSNHAFPYCLPPFDLLWHM